MKLKMPSTMVANIAVVAAMDAGVAASPRHSSRRQLNPTITNLTSIIFIWVKAAVEVADEAVDQFDDAKLICRYRCCGHYGCRCCTFTGN
ncbi:hypothetical protein COLO4_04568 [Corchorus olitorius]|uniref:Uncharacterized protein n=1 Tax=Corchorus olitorius TaxID=93759 RepID=A0A1R3KTG9_9ROSI|nr:hypothetical protein COLO4_04568 [Corchorus olitorius]